MKAPKTHGNVFTLREVLGEAERGGYAVGSFAPRYTAMIRPVLRAGEEARSPLIVQISQKELSRAAIALHEFAAEFYAALGDEGISIPVVLHLDHTKDPGVVRAAISAGFTSVMIDASERPLWENIAITREIVAYARVRGVSVEAELGKIGTTDFVETDADEELYTNPQEAEVFVRETEVDALAVSVGTAHGVYEVRQPKIDYERLAAIRRLTSVPLVLHGGSGVPAEMMGRAIRMPGGGISKVNIATDLEVACLGALGRKDRMLDAECSALPIEKLEKARAAVQRTAMEKITNFLDSRGRSETFLATQK